MGTYLRRSFPLSLPSSFVPMFACCPSFVCPSPCSNHVAESGTGHWPSRLRGRGSFSPFSMSPLSFDSGFAKVMSMSCEHQSQPVYASERERKTYQRLEYRPRPQANKWTTRLTSGPSLDYAPARSRALPTSPVTSFPQRQEPSRLPSRVSPFVSCLVSPSVACA